MNRFSRLGLAVAATVLVSTSPVISATAFAEGDAVKGATTFKKKCGSCHSLEAGKTKLGPTMHNVVGRHAGIEDGFRYSKINKAASEAGLIWTPAAIEEYIADPQSFLQTFLTEQGVKPEGRTKMTFKLRKPNERADVVAYLMSLSQ